MSIRIRSHAKINLGLAIGPVRPDGYHALATIYQTLAIHDIVSVTGALLKPGSTSQITITCNDERVPCDARNTCWKIVELALNRLKIAAQVTIHIDKRLPVQGGLGAGSANAAAVLIGLEKELHVALPGAERLAIAAETGSDVPLFLIGGTVLGLGRGEEVYPLPDLPAAETPENKLTAAAGSDRLKQLGRMWAAALAAPQELHTNATGVFPVKDRAGNLLLELVRAGIENDFEGVVFTQYPSLRDILETLKKDSQTETPAIYAALSGSGSALFGLYKTAVESSAAAKRLAQQGIPAYETKMLGREEYWRNIANASQ
jgi:4-diphosphocytidyl-2-C-methyl-D-erythritol kinase